MNSAKEVNHRRTDLCASKQRALIGLIGEVFERIVRLGCDGHVQQALDLADAFHNLPFILLGDFDFKCGCARKIKFYDAKYGESFCQKFLEVVSAPNLPPPASQRGAE